MGNPFDMTGHAALVTGSTAGIGRGIAEALADAGASVVLHGKAEDDAARAALESCRRRGVRTALLTGDLTGPSAELAERLCREAFDAEPDLDLLVNHAGGHQGEGAFESVPADLLDRTLRINVTLPWLLTQQVARCWQQRGTRGRVVFTGSVNGRLAEPGSAAYDTAKGAVEMMVRTLCVALAPRGIRVNGLAPGIVHAPRTAWLNENDALREWIRGHIPAGRIPRSTDLGPSVVYLLSEAAEFVNGHMLVVDGGISALQMPEPFVTTGSRQP